VVAKNAAAMSATGKAITTFARRKIGSEPAFTPCEASDGITTIFR